MNCRLGSDLSTCAVTVGCLKHLEPQIDVSVGTLKSTGRGTISVKMKLPDGKSEVPVDGCSKL